MNHLTNYYKNLSEQLQEKVNILQYRLKQLNEGDAPIANPSGIPPTGIEGIDPGMFDPRLVNPSDINPRYNTKPNRQPGPENPMGWPSNPTEGTVVVDVYGNVWMFNGTVWVVTISGNVNKGKMPRGYEWNPRGPAYPWDQKWRYPNGREPVYPRERGDPWTAPDGDPASPSEVYER